MHQESENYSYRMPAITESELDDLRGLNRRANHQPQLKRTLQERLQSILVLELTEDGYVTYLI
eukprot:scaffold272907_cov60-Attheya_sp.AAC.3